MAEWIISMIWALRSATANTTQLIRYIASHNVKMPSALTSQKTSYWRVAIAEVLEMADKLMVILGLRWTLISSVMKMTMSFL